MISVSVLALGANQGKYEGYVFTPEYSRTLSETEWESHREGYQPYMDRWQSPMKLDRLSLGEIDVLFVQIKLSNRSLFRKRKRMPGKKDLANWQGVIAYGKDFNRLLIKDEELLPEGRGGYDYYGCLDEQPLFKANIMGKVEDKEIFVVSGSGHRTDNIAGSGVRDHLKLHVYGGKQYNKLFDLRLMAVNYRPFDPDKPAKDYYFPQSDFGKIAEVESKVGEGRKLYSKLFIQDFNKNDRLDILVWQREYKSRPIKPGVKPGFDLDRSEFTWYEENVQGNGFDIKTISIDQAEVWLSDNKLTWKEGWPNENLCKNKRKDLPMVLGIDDPILE